MLVFLVRHGHADAGEPDELRPLSARGQDEARAVAERLAAHATPPTLVLTSPLLRARQTAEEIAEATGSELRVDERLAPGMTAEGVRAAVGSEHGPIAVVAHQPDCSNVALEVTGHDPGFRPGGTAELTFE